MENNKPPKTNRSRASVLAVALAMLTMALAAVPATATHDDTGISHMINNLDDNLPADDKKTKTHKDPNNANKTIYVNLGLIGDLTISCPSIYNFDGDVETFSPTTGAPGPSVTNNLDLDVDPNVCLGGAIGEYTGGESVWDIWITDYVWDSAEQLIPPDGGFVTHGNKIAEFKVSAFAQMRTTGVMTTDKTADPWDACVGPVQTGGTHVCAETDESRTVTYTKSSHQFGVCGQAQAAIDDTKLDHPTVTFDEVTTTKNVFVDGPIFYLLDCGLGVVPPPPGWIGEIVNSVTCNPENELPNLICVFEELPAAGATCLEQVTDDGNDVAVPGLVGTVGWSHPASITKCEKTTFDGSWVKTQGAFSLEIKNPPVVVS